MSLDASQAFQDLLEQLRLQSETNAQAINGEHVQPQWFAPPQWPGNVFDIEGLKTGFDRDIANKNYQDALSHGSIGPAMGAKQEMDYMAIQERAFRLRHSTTARLMAHTGARLYGHGSQAGVHTGVVVQSIVDLYKQQEVK